LKPAAPAAGFSLMKHCLIIALIICSLDQGVALCAQSKLQSLAFERTFEQTSDSVWQMKTDVVQLLQGDSLEIRDNARLVAIALNISLGMLGVHRMYLGTDVKIPILYTLTFGGGGVLWLVDLALLIANRDITPFMNNKNLFMFSRK
jgi:TM2 domain